MHLQFAPFLPKAISIHALREEGDRTGNITAAGSRYFNPRPPRGGRPTDGQVLVWCDLFQSTPSARRATHAFQVDDRAIAISIHALREEGDQDNCLRLDRQHNFNPRPPRGGRQHKFSCGLLPNEFQSTPSARRATGSSLHRPIQTLHFNPRPPRGGRHKLPRLIPRASNFNPRPPRGGRLSFSDIPPTPIKFQSTPSARRATSSSVHSSLRTTNFNPRPPRGGRPIQTLSLASFSNFNPRPPRGGRHVATIRIDVDINHFNPRPPRGGRPFCSFRRRGIHHFNPRPPRGGRLLSGYPFSSQQMRFQSTPSARRATCFPPACRSRNHAISIHALREEGDFVHPDAKYGDVNFNPRPPRGGRQHLCDSVLSIIVFQSTPSARRATQMLYARSCKKEISIHALREEGDNDGLANAFCDRDISIHALREEGDQISVFDSKSQIPYFNPRPPRGGRQRKSLRVPAV